MVVCDFNMCFTFALARWESFAHDTRIFINALRKPSCIFRILLMVSIFFFKILSLVCVFKSLYTLFIGKYYHANCHSFMGYLTPYKSIRYYLPRLRLGPKARERNEVFNYLLSSLLLRN